MVDRRWTRSGRGRRRRRRRRERRKDENQICLSAAEGTKVYFFDPTRSRRTFSGKTKTRCSRTLLPSMGADRCSSNGVDFCLIERCFRVRYLLRSWLVGVVVLIKWLFAIDIVDVDVVRLNFPPSSSSSSSSLLDNWESGHEWSFSFWREWARCRIESFRPGTTWVLGSTVSGCQWCGQETKLEKSCSGNGWSWESIIHRSLLFSFMPKCVWWSSSSSNDWQKQYNRKVTCSLFSLSLSVSLRSWWWWWWLRAKTEHHIKVAETRRRRRHRRRRQSRLEWRWTLGRFFLFPLFGSDEFFFFFVLGVDVDIDVRIPNRIRRTARQEKKRKRFVFARDDEEMARERAHWLLFSSVRRTCSADDDEWNRMD